MIRPGDPPVRWEAQVLNDHIRRVAREQDTAETLSTYGQRGQEILALQHESEQMAWQCREKFISRLGRALFGPETVTVRAVVETIEGRMVATRKTSIPPMTPLSERLSEVALLVRQAIQAQ